MLSLAEETRTEVTGGKGLHGSLNIRIPETLAASYLPNLLKQFAAQFPLDQLIFSTCAYHNLEQDLSKGIYDLAFLLAESYQAPNLSVKLLGWSLWSLQPHPNIVLPGKRLSIQKILLGKPFCLQERNAVTGEILNGCWRKKMWNPSKSSISTALKQSNSV